MAAPTPRSGWKSGDGLDIPNAAEALVEKAAMEIVSAFQSFRRKRLRCNFRNVIPDEHGEIRNPE